MSKFKRKKLEDTMDSNTQVTVKCNQCGEEGCFFPLRVVYLRDCSCGNTNYGSPSYDWPEDTYGNFTLVSKEQVVFYTETPFGRLRLG